jgi:hypothetical protein
MLSSFTLTCGIPVQNAIFIISIAYFSTAKKALAGKMEKKAEGAAKAGRQSWVLELPRHRCYTETIRGYPPPEKALKIKEKAL